MRRVLLTFARALLWGVLCVVALTTSLALHLQMPLARRIVRDELTDYVSTEIRGRLTVARFDEISLERVVARHVALFDGEGRRIIVADRVELALDLVALRRGEIHISAAKLSGAMVHLIDLGDGSPSLTTTFDLAAPGPQGGPDLQAVIEAVELADVTLYGDLLGLSGLRAERVQARGSMRVGEELDVRIDHARGQLVRPFGYTAEIDSLRGTFSTVEEQGIALHGSARRGAERAQVRVRYTASSTTGVDALGIDVSAQNVSAGTLHGLGYTWIGPIATPLTGTVRISGPTTDLALDAQVTTVAGDAQATGSISDARGVSVQLTTQSLEVAKILPDAPELNLRGSVQIDVPAEDDAEPRVHARVAGLRYRGFQIPSFELDGAIEEDAVRIDRATATSGARLSVGGRVRFDGSVDLDVNASFPSLQRDPNLKRVVGDAEGALVGAVRVRTSAKRAGQIDVQGRVVLSDLGYGSITASKVTLVGSARGDMELPTLNLKVTGENVALLAYPLGTARFALRGTPRAGYVADGEFVARGYKTFSLHADIQANRGGFVIQADPIEFSVGDNTWRGVARDLSVLHGRSFELGLLRLASRSQRLEAKGVIRLQGEDVLDAQLQDFDLAALRALLGSGFPLTDGRVDATVALRGDVARPELLLQGAMREATFQDIPGVNALYYVAYDNGQLELDTEVGIAERGTVRVTGSGALDPSISDPLQALEQGSFDVELASTDFDLTLLPAVRQRSLSGSVSGQLKVKGTLTSPSATGHVELAEFRAPDLAPLSAKLVLDYQENALQGSAALADQHGDLLAARGSLQLDWHALRDNPDALRQAFFSGQWQLTGEAPERRLDRLPFQLPGLSDLPILADARFELSKAAGPTDGFIRFTARTPDTVDDPSCGIRGRPELRGVLIAHGETTRFTFTGHMDDRRFASGQGDLDFSLDAFMRGEKNAAPKRLDTSGRIDIDALERFPGTCDHGKGDLHVSWSVRSLLTDTPTGEVQVRGSLQPRVRVKEGRYKQAVSSCSDDPVRFQLDGDADAQRVQLTGKLSGCRGGPTALSAFLPIAWNAKNLVPSVDDSRELHAEATFERTELRPLLDRLPGVLGFSATANGQLSARGRGDKIRYSGQLALSDGKLYLISTGQELTDVSLVMVGNGNWFKLESLRARAQVGTLQASGGLGFTGWLPRRIQLALLLDDFPVERESTDLATLDGSAALSTEIGDEKALTAVKIHALQIRLPNAATRSLQPLSPHPDIALTTEPPAISPEIPYTFEFFVDGRRRMTARRSDFEAVLRTELAVSYQEPSFRVGGYVEFQRGEFEVFGKDFELNRGSMHFDGTAELNPEVNLVATHEPGVTGASPVIVNVTGTLAQPIVEFHSEGCPGDGAVVMLIAGRCPTEDFSSAGDTQGTQDAFAAGIVGGILTLGAQRELGGLIPRISVESTGQGSQTRLKAGFEAVPKFMRSLVQRVYLQGAVSTRGGDGDATAEDTNNDATLDFLIELYFPHNIVGRGVFSQNNAWGLDVLWEP